MKKTLHITWKPLAKEDGWNLMASTITIQNSILRFLRKMKTAKLLHRVLISQDAGWYNVGDAGGGNFRNYNSIFDSFIPALLKSGFTEKDIQLLLVENPAKAFRIRKVNRKEQNRRYASQALRIMAAGTA